MPISKVGNIILAVSDLERSARFYRDVLGLKATGSVPGEFAFFDGGGVTIALRESASALSQTCHDEISFETDDVRAVYEELKSKGVRFSNPPRPVTGDGRRQLFATSGTQTDTCSR